MKGINKTGFPIKIMENGVSRIIPSDGQEYTIDDVAYEAYSELFIVTKMPVPPEIRAKRAEEQRKKDEIEAIKNKPLYGVHVKPELLRKPIFMESLYKERKKFGKRNKWDWHLESPEGEIIKNVDIKKWCEDNNWVLTTLYRWVPIGKKYRGWKVTRTEKV